MGLSSSQGRLLMLTSRLSDIELGEVMISQRQNTLALESEKAATEYNDAVSNHKLQIKVTDTTDDKGYRKEDVTFSNMTSMGYLVTNANKQIYLQKDENGEWIIPNDLDGNPLLTINSDGKATIGEDTETTYDLLDGGTYLSDKTVLQNAIMNGLLFVMDTADQQTGISLTTLQSETQMEYVLDTSDDAAAQSKYECETARISRQDSQLDMELQQLETQHEAIMKEYDSVKEVISSNVDRTFNLFSDG